VDHSSSGPTFDDLLDPAIVAELREMGAGFSERVLPDYLRQAPTAAAAIAAAAARRDLTELAALAHRLGGSSGTLGGHRLAATCTALDQAAACGDVTTAVDLALTVERQTEATCQALHVAFTAS
jgi:HPt (histidine-containing phosphotransfer) domain-containing protein